MEEKSFEIVWLQESRMFAEVVSLNAYFSLVRYTREGIDYEEVVMNDEFEYVDGGSANDD